MIIDKLTQGAIVLGGHIQGYGIIRILGELGIPSIVIDYRKLNISHHSKYCEASYVVSYSDTIRFLLKLASLRKYYRWVIFPTDDYYVRLLSTNFGALSESFHLSVDIWDRVIKFFDKRLSYPLADATGIPIPHTFYPQSVTDLNRMLGVIPYPCIIKPAIMLDFYKAFNKKVLLCNTEVELVSNYQFASKTIAASELMIQEVIPGDSSNQYSVGIFFGKDKTYNHLIARRKRQHPIDFGNATTYAETVNIPLLLHYAEKLLAASEYTGVCEVEFKYDARDGLYKFLEVNPRLWKWHAIAKQCDVPLLESMFSYYTKGMPLQTTLYKEASWRDIVTDTKVVLELLLKKKHISIDNKPEIQAVFNTKDILPFIMQLLYLPCFVFSKNRDCGV